MRILASVTAALAMSLPLAAAAADLPQRYAPPAPVMTTMPFNWAGGYVGVSAGYMFDRTTRATGYGLAGNQFSKRYINGTNGFVGGVFGGYNFTAGNVVYGVEANVDYADSHATRRTFHGIASTGSDLGFNGALRARLGYSLDRALFYVNGGVALADVKYTATDVTGTAKKSSTEFGYTLGAGMEYAVTSNLLLRTEYAFTDYGDKTLATGGGRYNFETRTHTMKAGLGYKF